MKSTMLNTFTSQSREIDVAGGEQSQRSKNLGEELLPAPVLTFDEVSNSTKVLEQNASKDLRKNICHSACSPTSPSRSNSFQYFSSTSSACSHILPKDSNIIMAVVLSKWDDIMGPQTLHVWLQEDSEKLFEGAHFPKEVPLYFNSHESTSTLSTESEGPQLGNGYIFSEESSLLSAVKYVTNHTVNCLTVSANFGSSNNSHEKGTSFFAVPDINLVFLSLLFQVKEQKTTVPYSIALIVSYQHYDYFLQLRGLCLQWLKRIALRFHISLVKNSSTSELCLWKNLNDWILEFCNMLVELRQSGLQTMQFQVPRDVIRVNVLRRALTSHLQTFGCSVVIGTNALEINSMIAFLGLFLEESEKHSTCLVNPSRKYAFHMGLKLQGLVIDEFGGRDLASMELTSNPIPVTVIDLTLGDIPSAVKQTSNFHLHLINQQEMYKQEYRYLNQGSGCSGDHESVMHSVRENGKLVNDLLKEMKLLPVEYWEKFVSMFLQRLNHLAMTLLNLVSWVRKTGGVIKLPGERKGGGMTLVKYLKQSLKVDDADFLIILSKAEKLKPGTYTYVMEVSHM